MTSCQLARGDQIGDKGVVEEGMETSLFKRGHYWNVVVSLPEDYWPDIVSVFGRDE